MQVRSCFLQALQNSNVVLNVVLNSLIGSLNCGGDRCSSSGMVRVRHALVRHIAIELGISFDLSHMYSQKRGFSSHKSFLF